MVRTRFAPSPTGLLHIGHAYSALFSERAAREADGAFLLRIEDIDPARCRPNFEAAIIEDLAWLGLKWLRPVRRQSDNYGDYERALDKLDDKGLLYPCFCTRKEIRAEIEAAGHAPHGPDGPHYPGICRALSKSAAMLRIIKGEAYAYRLKTDEAIAEAGPLTWHDRDRGEIEAKPQIFGDVVLARKDVRTSYHLSVTVDDHLQEISLVTRGEDLAEATHIHRLLQALLDLDVPEYQHHRLLTGDDGKRYAKRDKALTLQALREAGKTPDDVKAMTGWPE